MSAPAPHRTPINASLFALLRELLGNRFSTSAAVCAQHGKDESYHTPHSPDAVAFARSTEEVAAIVLWCEDGPPGAFVRDLQVWWDEPLEHFARFEVRPTSSG